MKIIKIVVFAWVTCVTVMMSVAAAADTLTLGIFPYLSPDKLVALHRPLRDSLEEIGTWRVRLVGAPSFKLFRERTRDGAYDMVLTAPHLARLAEQESGYRRVVMSSHRGRPVFLTRNDSGINDLTDLRGRVVALPPSTAIIHHVALRALREIGLEPGKSVSVIVTPTHSSALLSSLNGQSAVSVMGKSPWETNRGKYGDRLKVLSTSAEIPGFVIMAHPRLSIEEVTEIREHLLRFAGTEKGQGYIRAAALEGIIPVDNESMQEMDPYNRAIFGNVKP